MGALTAARRNRKGEDTILSLSFRCLTALSSGERHRRRNLGEDGADACGNTRHDCAGRYGNEPCHQGVLDEVLSAGISPNSQLPNQIGNTFHVVYPLPATIGVTLLS